MKQSWPLDTLLAVLQQAEYDWSLLNTWLKRDRDDDELIMHLESLRPEKQTKKLQLIALLAKTFQILLPTALALRLAILCFAPAQNVGARWIIWKAQQKLKRLRKKNKLQVIAIAGSYGKTSVKHSVSHVLGNFSFCCVSPASYNTPLGLSKTILNDLRPDHEFLILEFGEYITGDLSLLQKFFHPDITIITPIGYAHSERWQDPQEGIKLFEELFSSPHAAPVCIVSDHNRSILSSAVKNYLKVKDRTVSWYGEQSESEFKLESKSIVSTVNVTTGNCSISGNREKISCSLLGEQSLINVLPALGLAYSLGFSLKTAVRSLQYHPAISRRLEKQVHTNGTLIMDNSYNSNPGSWKMAFPLLQETEQPRALLTAGFLELDRETTEKEHAILAQNLLQSCQAIGLLYTHANKSLWETLSKQSKVPVVTGNTQEEVLQKITSLRLPLKTIWLEGGCREIYQ